MFRFATEVITPRRVVAVRYNYVGAKYPGEKTGDPTGTMQQVSQRQSLATIPLPLMPSLIEAGRRGAESGISACNI